MGLGIRDDKHLKVRHLVSLAPGAQWLHVPGTSVFSKDPNAIAAALYEGVDLNALKHGKGKHEHIVLVPQPSEDPNDPLNWSTAKKWTTFMVLLYGTTLCGALGPLVSAGQVELAADFGVSLSAISRALGTSLVTTLAIATIFWSAWATKLGKRSVFLFTTAFMLIGSIIAGEAKNYGTLLGSRIIQAVGQSGCEFLVGSSIADIFFVHERGTPISLWNLGLLGGISVTPPIAGKVFAEIGWRWCFRIFSIATALLLVMMVVIMPETTYERAAVVPPGALTSRDGDEKTSGDIDHVERGSAASAHGPKKSFVQEMALFSGVYRRDRSFLGLLVEPFKLLASPVVQHAIWTYGLAITFLVVIATGAAQVFAGSYGFGPSGTGNVYVAALIGNLLGAAVAGPLTDWTAERLSSYNNGFFEPEFRLPLLSAYFLFGGTGLFAFGAIAQKGLSSWGVIVMFGVLNFGITVGCHAIIAHVVECHRKSSDAALGAVIFGKNALSAIFSAFTNLWIEAGIDKCFYSMGALAMATSLLGIPMWIYGKKARSWIARNLHSDEQTSVVAS
ncbi:hypothetical protein JCM8097_008795 [Rhodosporidiobolus ruineniae]